MNHAYCANTCLKRTVLETSMHGQPPQEAHVVVLKVVRANFCDKSFVTSVLRAHRGREGTKPREESGRTCRPSRWKRERAPGQALQAPRGNGATPRGESDRACQPFCFCVCRSVWCRLLVAPCTTSAPHEVIRARPHLAPPTPPPGERRMGETKKLHRDCR